MKEKHMLKKKNNVTLKGMLLSTLEKTMQIFKFQ